MTIVAIIFLVAGLITLVAGWVHNEDTLLLWMLSLPITILTGAILVLNQLWEALL